MGWVEHPLLFSLLFVILRRAYLDKIIGSHPDSFSSVAVTSHLSSGKEMFYPNHVVLTTKAKDRNREEVRGKNRATQLQRAKECDPVRLTFHFTASSHVTQNILFCFVRLRKKSLPVSVAILSGRFPPNHTLAPKAWFKRRILQAPNRIAKLNAYKMRRLNQLNATYFNSMRVTRIFDWSSRIFDWSSVVDLNAAFYLCRIELKLCK